MSVVIYIRSIDFKCQFLTWHVNINVFIFLKKIRFLNYNRHNVDLSKLIHHSDRGVQYCSNLYVGMLKKHHINISMTPCGDPLHNALAERMNNTIKNGWLFDCTDDSFEQLDKRIADAIYAYNYVRPHQGIQMRTPMEYIRKCSGKVAEVPLVGTGAPTPILMDYASEF